MYAIIGVTGQVGGATARALLQGGHKVRAVVREAAKSQSLKEFGAEVAVADLLDSAALSRAFSGVEGAYVMVPPDFSPQPGFPGARAVTASLAMALTAAGVPKVVLLSSIGGHRESGLGLITQVHILEQGLADLPAAVAVLRPAWFMENSAWDVRPARDSGEMPAFLTPLDRPYPMVATADIGQVAARTLTQNWSGRRVIEIEGPQRYSQLRIAKLLGQALGREVVATPVPREQWQGLFVSQGSTNPAPRIEMIDAFNSGWIAFEPGRHEHVIGATSYETVLRQLAQC